MLSFERLERRVGEAFSIGDGTDRFEAILTEVAARDAPQSGFSALWRASTEPRFTQGTVTVAHPELGEVELFLVCLGPRDSGSVYEAVFS